MKVRYTLADYMIIYKVEKLIFNRNSKEMTVDIASKPIHWYILAIGN